MYEHSSYGSRSGVEIFVAAPHSGVDIPLVEVEWDIPDCVSEIPYYEDACFASCGCDGRDVEELAGVVLYSGKEEYCCR